MPVSDYTPSLAQVAALVRTRTVDANGNETGTFSAATRPDQTEAAAFIGEAVQESYPTLGQSIPDAPGDPLVAGYDKDELRKSAAAIVAYRAAAILELTLFPEQVAAGRSPYAQYQASYENGLKRLANAIEQAGGGDAPASGSNGSLSPSFAFPADGGGMVGWNTRF